MHTYVVQHVTSEPDKQLVKVARIYDGATLGGPQTREEIIGVIERRPSGTVVDEQGRPLCTRAWKGHADASGYVNDMRARYIKFSPYAGRVIEDPADLVDDIALRPL